MDTTPQEGTTQNDDTQGHGLQMNVNETVDSGDVAEAQDLEVTDDDADSVSGGDGKVPLLPITIKDAPIGGYS